jgi:hypothetical protein
VSEPDDGQAQAINKGFGLATGAWLGWLNADDALTPRSAELAMAAATRRPSAGWIYGKCEIHEGSERSIYAPPPRVGPRAVREKNPLAQPGTLVARWALERVGPLDEQLDLVMDFDLWLRLIDAGVPALYVPEILAVFEIHADSKTGSIPARDWALEDAAAMLKRGHASDGALLLGRIAARSVHEFGSPIDPSKLESEITAAIDYGRNLTPTLDSVTVRAAAYAEAAERELFAPRRSYRYLFSREPWRVPRTRKRLVSALVGRTIRLVARRARPSKKPPR